MKKLMIKVATAFALLFVLFTLLFTYTVTSLSENALKQETRDGLELMVNNVHDVLQDVSGDDIINNQRRWVDAQQNLREALNPADRVSIFDVNGREIFSYGNGALATTLMEGIDGTMPRQVHYQFRPEALNGTNGYQFKGPLYNKDQNITGYLTIVSEMRRSVPSTDHLIGLSFVGSIAVSLGIIIISLWFFDRIRRSVNATTALLNNVSSSGDQQPYQEQGIEEIDEIGFAINDMMSRLNHQTIRLNSQKKRMSLLLDHLVVGVMLIDEEGVIRIANDALMHILNLDESVEGQCYADVLPGYRLTQMIALSLQEKQAISDEIYYYYPKEVILDVNVVFVDPNDTPDAASDQIIVLLYDITEIRQLEKVRSDFIANASHELKTPITAIKGFAETLLNGALGDPETAEEFVGIINKESLRIESLISDILDLSKIEQHQITHDYTPINMAEVLENTEEQLVSMAEKHDITLSTAISDPTLEFIGEAGRLNQILTNLGTNAIKYNHPGGHVQLTGGITEDQQYVVFTVSDDGDGIPEGDLPRIFERFYRVDKNRSTATGGTGLGLSIVRNLIETMGGTIDVTSQLGEGSTFKVYLPKQNPAFMDSEFADDMAELDDDYEV